MTLTPWPMAFAAALTIHALGAALLPQALIQAPERSPSPKPVLVSLATPPPAPALPTPAATPPAPVRPTPPVARRPEPEPSPPTPEVAPPQSAPVPTTVKQEPLAQPSVAAVNPPPVATPQTPPARQQPLSATTTEPPTPETPATPTTAAAPTSVLDTVDLAQLRSQYGKTAHHWLNKHKRYPRRAEYRGDEGTVLVKFIVNRRGEVLSYGLESSSGNALLDKEALALIQRAQPLPVFPDELAKARDTITVLVTIPFQLR